MYIARIPNRNSKPTVLIRQDRREGKKIIKQKLANITHLPAEVIEQIEIIIRGGCAAGSGAVLHDCETYAVTEQGV